MWRVAIDLGNPYRAQRRDEEAEHAFATAQELIEALAATIPDSSLRTHFLQQASALLPRDESLSPRRAAKRAFDGLTEREREREVAALIAQGKASREIAESLVVNSRTIEKHIENILSKLGFTSRAQIAAWAIEKGLTNQRTEHTWQVLARAAPEEWPYTSADPPASSMSASLFSISRATHRAWYCHSRHGPADHSYRPSSEAQEVWQAPVRTRRTANTWSPLPG